MRLGVLASGTGSNLAAIVSAGLEPVVVVVDRPCPATSVADGAGIPAVVVERDSYGPSFDRLSYTHRVVDVLQSHDVELVVLAGFMTILDKPVFDHWAGRILNTHPALLPAFPGAHAVRDALEAGVKVTGCTVHIATETVDAGPILAQEAVPVLPDDTVETLHERIKEVERVIFPRTIRLFAEGKLP